jgi:soluble lytic murein transglycosylase-like protein
MDITPTTTTSDSEIRKARIQKVAHDFESLFTSMMLKSMRKASGDNPMMPQSFGEKIYTEMLDDEYSKMSGKHGFIGLAAMIEKELERQDPAESSNDKIPESTLENMWIPDNSFITSQKSQSSSIKQSGTIRERVNKWESIINDASQTYNVDNKLISAIIAQESGGNQYAVSKAGAKGLMQLMDSTANDLGVDNSFSPKLNIMGGTRYIRSLLDKYNGNEQLALASYNAGPGAVDKYNGIPPYTETQNYVKSVLELKSQFTDDQEL